MTPSATPARTAALCVALVATTVACHHAPASSDPPSSTAASMNIYSLPIKTLEGKDSNLDAYAGKVTLLVNVASFCGKTPQYKGLEALHERYQAQGFSVLGFPSNDFGQQEPGSPQEIRDFCSTKYKVTFPLFEKLKTKKGEGQSPLYTKLGEASGKLPSWNFAKYLVGRDGHVISFFDSSTVPEDPKLVSAIETALAAPK
ncbi:MAG TPA: glutathione peroxidase [Polyangiaceae bacterium]|nr:glutathione peroxidase [Polyangiaceae bacterium]